MLENMIRKYVKKEQLNNNIEKYENSINELERLTKKLNEKDRKLREHYHLIELENNILKLITMGTDFNQVLYKICESIETFNEEDNVFVSILSYDKYTNNLFNLCSPNLNKNCTDLIEEGIPVNDKTISCSTAACKRKIIEIEDIENSSYCTNNFPEVRDQAIQNNIKACYSSPIIGSDDKLLGSITLYFKDDSYQDKIYKDLLCWAAKITSIIIEKKNSEDELNKSIKEIKQKNSLLESIIDASGGYLWMKDKNDKYKFSDYNYHYNLFGKRDKNDVIGKTSKELVDNYIRETSKENQYEDISRITDDYTKNLRNQTRFLCGGYIGDDLYIFEIIKTPLFDIFGNYKGIVGFLWDRSSENELVLKDIEILRNENRLKILSNNEYPDTPFMYYIIPNRKYYRKLISKPIYEDPSIIDKRVMQENYFNE